MTFRFGSLSLGSPSVYVQISKKKSVRLCVTSIAWINLHRLCSFFFKCVEFVKLSSKMSKIRGVVPEICEKSGIGVLAHLPEDPSPEYYDVTNFHEAFWDPFVNWGTRKVFVLWFLVLHASPRSILFLDLWQIFRWSTFMVSGLVSVQKLFIILPVVLISHLTFQNKFLSIISFLMCIKSAVFKRGEMFR